MFYKMPGKKYFCHENSVAYLSVYLSVLKLLFIQGCVGSACGYQMLFFLNLYLCKPFFRKMAAEPHYVLNPVSSYLLPRRASCIAGADPEFNLEYTASQLCSNEGLSLVMSVELVVWPVLNLHDIREFCIWWDVSLGLSLICVLSWCHEAVLMEGEKAPMHLTVVFVTPPNHHS